MKLILPLSLILTLSVVLSSLVDQRCTEPQECGGESEEVNTSGGGLGPRTRRFPKHLDPNIIPFFPFWIRVGECPVSLDGAKQHFCPTPTTAGKWVCVDDYQLCDGIKNCPNAEDESSFYCLFYKVLKSEVEMLSRSISSLTGVTTMSPTDDYDDDGSYGNIPQGMRRNGRPHPVFWEDNILN